MSQDPSSPDFAGAVRLFPLPNLVLFPHVAQPLHIFEARYRQMMADALEDDRLLAMALLRPGWEEDYHKKPAIHPMVCVGRILYEERLSDGRYNLVLQGLERARILEEVPTDRLYRTARVESCADVPASSTRQDRLRQDLGQAVTPLFAANAEALEQVQQLLAGAVPLGQLCDIFSFALPLDMEIKQALLEEVNVEARIRLLLASLPGGQTPPRGRRYPPGFSDN